MTRNQKLDLIRIRRGLAIYRVGRSPYWQARIYNATSGKYVVRSTRETSRSSAKVAAEELVGTLAAQGQFKPQPESKDNTTFRFYAERVMKAGSNTKFAARDDARILTRPNDGVLAVLGDLDIRTVKTATIREYMHSLNQGRESPLSESTLAKHVIVIRKVFSQAIDEGAIATMPALPKQSARPQPRPSFTDEQYDTLLKAARAEAKAGHVVKGRCLTDELVNIIEFMVGSFIRPLESELFSLKLADVEVKGVPQALHLKIHAGKNGARTTVTMPECVQVFSRQVALTGATKPDEFLFFPSLRNRKMAVTAARQMFNHVLESSGLKTDTQGKGRQLYSLRHYSIQKRITASGGLVNIYTLAKNAGTSVEMIEKFYARFLAPSDAMIANLHYQVAAEASHVDSQS